MFRLLNAAEIECRVARSGMKKDGSAWASILLYKDARVDQRVMDETLGPMNWQAEYELLDGRLYCKVKVWDSEKNCWISKMNVGTESNTEKEKGQASDALKRACFTWGLGVELYSAPQIFVELRQGEYDVKDKKVYPSLNLSVKDISYDDNRKIASLVLVDKKGEERYVFGVKAPKTAPKPPKKKETTPVQKAGENNNMAFVSKSGKKMTIGDATWMYAIKQTAKGEACADGTPIPIWIAEEYSIPDAIMAIFCGQVENMRVELGVKDE